MKEEKAPRKWLGLETFRPFRKKRINLKRSEKTKERDFELLRLIVGRPICWKLAVDKDELVDSFACHLISGDKVVIPFLV